MRPGPRFLLMKTPPVAIAVLLLFIGRTGAQVDDILDDPALYELLNKHQDRQYPLGKAFPSERLDCLFYENAVAYHAIRDRSGAPKILLTSVPTNLASYELFPNVLHLDANGTWRRTPIPVTWDGWTHVHRSKDGLHLLLAMDNVPESRGWDTKFVLSDDGGHTWSYGASIRKYIYFDVIRYFKMNESGAGTAIEHYTGGVDGYEQIGYYVYRTHDWGYTWSDF